MDDEMTTFSEEDFRNADFAVLPKYGLRAHKSAGDASWQRDGIKRVSSAELAEAGWVPVSVRTAAEEEALARLGGLAADVAQALDNAVALAATGATRQQVLILAKIAARGICRQEDLHHLASTGIVIPALADGDHNAAAEQDRRESWAEGHQDAATDYVTIARGLSMEALDLAWEEAEVETTAKSGDVLIRKHGGGYTIHAADIDHTTLPVSTRILHRAPKPQLELPTEAGARFIAHSPHWCDNPEDQRECIVAGDLIVDLSSGALFGREAFEAEWTVTGLVSGDEQEDER